MAEKPLIQQFQDDLIAAVDKYRDSGLTLGEMVGAMELTKMQVWHDINDEEDSDDDRWQ